MFDLFLDKLTGDKEYLNHFKKGADFWNEYFIDKKYGDTYVGVILDGKIKDDKKAGKYKTLMPLTRPDFHSVISLGKERFILNGKTKRFLPYFLKYSFVPGCPGANLRCCVI
jgi:hypothetical protein